MLTSVAAKPYTYLGRMKRLHELDGLRAAAILSVLLIHFSPHSNAFLFGWVGVDLFFVISGYLITTILLGLRDHPRPYRVFYWRRSIRILPAYYVVLAGVAILVALKHEPSSRATWMSPIFFLPAINHGISFHLIAQRLAGAPFDFSHQAFARPLLSRFVYGIGVYWSLAVEELFYLLWAPVVLKAPRRWLLTIALVPILMCPLLRGLTHTSSWGEGIGFLTRFDTLAVGALLALLLSARPETGWKVLLTPIPVLLILLASLCVKCGMLQGQEVRSYELFAIVGYTFVALLFGCIVGMCVRWTGSPALAILRFGPFVYLGVVSYAVYLIHCFVYVGVAKLVSGDVVRAVVATATTIAIAAASWKWFEGPILRLRNLVT